MPKLLQEAASGGRQVCAGLIDLDLGGNKLEKSWILEVGHERGGGGGEGGGGGGGGGGGVRGVRVCIHIYLANKLVGCVWAVSHRVIFIAFALSCAANDRTGR